MDPKRKCYSIEELHMFLQKAKVEKFLRLEQRCKNKSDLKTFCHGQKVYSDRGFFLTENYCLSDPFSGQEVVLFQDRPVWMMNYLGSAIEETQNLSYETILELLKMAIMAIYKPGGLYGWINYEKDGYVFMVHNIGEASMYNGKGYIYDKNGREIFQYTYYGGIVSD